MDPPSASGLVNDGFPFPKLKSVVAVFFGLFCILCFKKLIGFGRRWKNILIDWGYRSLNAPSLWTSDAIVDHLGQESTASSSSHHADATAHTAKRIPALRVPDAWSNFLLTWMHLNLTTISSLVPAWISAINCELRRRTSVGVDRDIAYCAPYHELKVQSIRPPISPPRLSFMETSASGSTKELHFHCTLSSPEVYLEITLVRSPQHSVDGVSESECYLVHLQQIICRVQIICAVLEGDYVLLSWKMVSPLLTQPLRLLDTDMQPVAKLPNCDARWIKDTVYLAIQSAVVRLVISPLCLTVVEQWFPQMKLPSVSSTPKPVVTSAERSKVPTFGLEPRVDLPSALSTDSLTTNAIHLRVLYAVLLEPVNLDSFDPLTTAPLICRIRWNTTLTRTVDQDAAETTNSALLTTTGVRLEPKLWPSNSQSTDAENRSNPLFGSRLSGLALSRPVAQSYMAVWNQDAHIPVSDVSSNLLDVSLYTEPGPDSSVSSSICGHAILPLPKLNEDPSKSQHVLLVDCYPGNPNDDWPTYVPRSPEIRAKFMLILRVRIISDVTHDRDPVDFRVDSPQSGIIKPAIPKPSVPPTFDSKSLLTQRPPSAVDTGLTTNPYNTVSTEQLAQFMSSSGTAPQDISLSHICDKTARRRSRSYGDSVKAVQDNTNLSDNQSSPRHTSFLRSASGQETNGGLGYQVFQQYPAQPGIYPPASSAVDFDNSLIRTPERKKKKLNLRKGFMFSGSSKKLDRTTDSLFQPSTDSFISHSPSDATIQSTIATSTTAEASPRPGKSRFRRLLGSMRRKPNHEHGANDRRKSG